jgi:CheY-like chemotaxis protein
MRILIVEDNASLRQLLASLFTNAGHEVVAMVEDGSEQVEIEIKRTQPDIICLDYNLPGRDGITILQSIQAIAPQIDVLFMTASDEKDLAERAADAGASGFIRKPFGQVQIMRELAVVCETRKHAAPVASEPKTKAATVIPDFDGPKSRRGTAVIADDSGSVRLVLKGLLEECGLKVVQTVSADKTVVSVAASHGASGYIIKPLRPAHVVAYMDRLFK